MAKKTNQLLRARVLSFSAPPNPETRQGIDYWEDAVLEVNAGIVSKVWDTQTYIAAGHNLTQAEDLRPGLILPGFIDAHIHFPQLNIIGSYGKQMIDWLDQYAFPAEMAFTNREHAEANADVFLDTILQAGTTSGLVFTAVQPHTTEVLMQASAQRNMRMISGKVLMDRNAPAELLDDEDLGISSSAALIEAWHGHQRLSYAITPRFAISSTPAQLSAAAELLARYPGVYLHSHLAESKQEIAEVLALYPDAKSYTDVYAQHLLLSERSVFAHGIHLSGQEVTQLRGSGSKIVFCPTSNLFLGSGLLDLRRFDDNQAMLAVGTDVGGGTSFSMLATLGEGYKVGQLQGFSWHPMNALYAGTLGNARALHIDHSVGRLAAGYEADFIVLNPAGNPLVQRRLASVDNIDDELFAMMIMGDERVVQRTYVAGQLMHQRDL